MNGDGATHLMKIGLCGFSINGVSPTDLVKIISLFKPSKFPLQNHEKKGSRDGRCPRFIDGRIEKIGLCV